VSVGYTWVQWNRHKRIYDTVEGRDERIELNLYLSGYDEDVVLDAVAPDDAMASAGGPEGSEE